MKSRGIFSCLCRSLDCMEDEMRGLCRLFLKKGKPKHKERCSPCCDAGQKRPEIPPDFCPPCGRSCPCCKKEKDCCEF